MDITLNENYDVGALFLKLDELDKITDVDKITELDNVDKITELDNVDKLTELDNVDKLTELDNVDKLDDLIKETELMQTYQIDLFIEEIIKLNTDYDFYVGKLYKALSSTYNEMIKYSERCTNLTICNDVLKQKISQLEKNSATSFVKGRFTIDEQLDEDFYY